MHENVPVRFGGGRLEKYLSIVTGNSLAAYPAESQPQGEGKQGDDWEMVRGTRCVYPEPVYQPSTGEPCAVTSCMHGSEGGSRKRTSNGTSPDCLPYRGTDESVVV